jgi:ketosteroid isomerase-like protein
LGRFLTQPFLDLKLKISMEVTAVQNGEGNLALTRTKTTATGIDAEGKPVSMSGKTVELVRRQPDGTWLFVIDDQHGAE